MKAPIAFVNDERFTRPSLMQPFMAQEINVTQGITPSPEEETILFLQLNYHRYRMCLVRRRILRQNPWNPEDVRELLDLNQCQLDARSKIVTANMGLVLAMAQRSNYHGVEFTDLVSEGSMALLRATEKFDCARRIKFSTYAYRSIFKAFFRAAKLSYRYRNRYPIPLDIIPEKSNYLEVKRVQNHLEWVDEVQTIVEDNLAELTAIEMSIVAMRFGLDDRQEPMTLKEVGERLGLTKERIRQIQNKALKKLRDVADECMMSV
jgi:RNA polymerase primary sigma factor/RNA polymerase sigma factor